MDREELDLVPAPTRGHHPGRHRLRRYPPQEEPPATPPAGGQINDRCAQLSQEVTDAYNRGDTEAEKAGADEFDRLAEAGECD
jgi:hypothetical protein